MPGGFRSGLVGPGSLAVGALAAVLSTVLLPLISFPKEDAGGRAPVTITASVDPESVPVGTPFRYTLRVEAGPETEVMVPVLSEAIGSFQITDFGEIPRDTGDGPAVVERWYTLVGYETGAAFIPGTAVLYRTPGSELQSVTGPKTLMRVESLLPQGGEPVSLRDIKGLVAVPRDYAILWYFAAAAAVAGSLGWAFYRFLGGGRGTAAEVARPPHEEALEALVRLRRMKLLDRSEQESYYVRLSTIVRRYLEARFHLRAPEMTTEEFLQVAQRETRLASDQRSLLQSFLREADLVKFARYAPPKEDGERAYTAARSFVEATAATAEGPDAVS